MAVRDNLYSKTTRKDKFASAKHRSKLVSEQNMLAFSKDRAI